MASDRPAYRPIISCAIDDVALASLRSGQNRAAEVARCSVCDAPISDQPAATGLLLWTRGAEVRVDEPPLCRRCVAAIGLTTCFPFGGHDEG